MTGPAPILLRTPQAAARLGVSSRTLCRWAETRPEVKSARFGRSYWRVALIDQIGGAK